MSPWIILALLGLLASGLGFVGALITRRYGPTIAGGFLAFAGLYVLYVFTTGEGAPFVPYVMVAGAVGGAALMVAFALGVALARSLERAGIL